jgi:hypothetical protein
LSCPSPGNTSGNSSALQLPSPTMHRRSHLAVFALVAGLLVLGLCSCGSGSGDPTVASVGSSKISRSSLNHWMLALAGDEYHHLAGTSAPAGLISEPANYPRCVAVAKRIKPKTLPAPVPNEARLKIRCRQLHTAIKEQALSYLISTLWLSEEGAKAGQSVSDREVSRQLQEHAYREYPSPAAFRRSLASRHWSVADERYSLKNTLLDNKFLGRIEARAAALGGGQPTFVRLVNERNAKWKAKTRCSSGYTAWQCRPDGSGREAEPPASVVIEQLGGVGS